MTVYVDHLRPAPWRFRRAAHLVADSILELHAFAASIGLRRAWFQDGIRANPERKPVPHYDLVPSKHAAALAAGAVLLGRREFVERFMR